SPLRIELGWAPAIRLDFAYHWSLLVCSACDVYEQDRRQVWERCLARGQLRNPLMFFLVELIEAMRAHLRQAETFDCATTRCERVRALLAFPGDAVLMR